MHAWESIRHTLDYIETHLSEEFSIEDLAGMAALSPFYYQRLFSRLVGRPVREYIKLRRLAWAADAFRDTDKRVLDIALDAGFGSHETLTRAFKEAYGMPPEQYRARPVHLNHFDKPDLMLGYTLVDEGVPLITEGLVLELNRRALTNPVHFMGVTGHVPIQGQIPLGEDTGVDIPGEIWTRFHREKHLLPRVPDGRELGVAYLGDAPQGSFTYFAGAEVAEDAHNDRFVRWTLPAREYIICGFEAENFHELTTAALNKAVKYSGLWLDKRGLTQELYSPEVYYDSSQAGTYMELWIPLAHKA